MIKIFISYSHIDDLFRKQLERHLSSLKRIGLIDTWSDRQIIPGENWADNISDGLAEAKIILLLISADFLFSDYCYDIEMKTALARHQAKEAIVIPVILKYCDWNNTPFAVLQGLPSDGKPLKAWDDLDQGFLDVVDGIKAAIHNLSKDCVVPVRFGVTPSEQISELRKRALTSLNNRELRKLLFDINEFKKTHVSNFEIEELEASVKQGIEYETKLTEQRKPVEIKWYQRRTSFIAAASAACLLVIAMPAYLLTKHATPMYSDRRALQSKYVILSGEVEEKDTILIIGNYIPRQTDYVKVLFNDIPGEVQSLSGYALKVKVPELGDRYGEGNVKVGVIVNGDTSFVQRDLLVQRTPLPALNDELAETSSERSLAKETWKNQKLKVGDKSDLAKEQTILIPHTTPTTARPPDPVTSIPDPYPAIPPKVDYNKMVTVSAEFKKPEFLGRPHVVLKVGNNSTEAVQAVVNLAFYDKKMNRFASEQIVIPVKQQSFVIHELKVPSGARSVSPVLEKVLTRE